MWLFLHDYFFQANSFMKYFLFFCAFVFSGTAAFAQKHDVEVEDGEILVDDTPFANIERDGCGFGDAQCAWYISNLQGKKLLTVRQMVFKDPIERSASNKEGTVVYFQYTFSGSDAKAETAPVGIGKRDEKVATRVVKARLIKDSALEPDVVADFIAENGTPYSDRRKAIGGPDVIIINNR
jgi:hypothetical protein